MRNRKKKYCVNESIFDNEDDFVRFCNMSLQKRLQFLKERDITFPGADNEKEI